ncbi:MAG TPA: response regulator [Oculatellaceae cyanobacterium]
MKRGLKVLLVEDSVADATLIIEVFEEEKISVDVTVVRDGIECMEFLQKAMAETESGVKALPDMMLLDLNLPRMDGREVLTEIKAHPVLCSIPVVILTTSQSEEDVLRSYSLQASCYVTKPLALDQFVKIVRSIDEFWFTAVKYPAKA